MSALDVSDPHISLAYDLLAHNDSLQWFLLAYGNKPNQLGLCASGTGGLDQLRSNITPGHVYYGLFREHNNDSPIYISLAIIPDSVGGVRRARALVHARAIQSIFKTPQSLNATNPEELTTEALRNAPRLPPHSATMTTHSHLSTGLPTKMDSASPRIDSGPQVDYGVTPASPTLTPSDSKGPISQARSRRIFHPRLPMFSASKDPAPSQEQVPAVSSPQAHAAKSPVSHANAPSHPPTISLPTDNLDSHPSSNSPGINVPNDLRQALLLAKNEAPLPPPPPGQESERNSEEFLPYLQPALGPIDDESSETDYGVPIHESLVETGNTDGHSSPMPAHAPAPPLASPIGSIPDEHSIRSKASADEPSSPVHGPSNLASPDERKSTSAVSTNVESTARTPAQEEAERAREGWVSVDQTVDQTVDTAPPTPPSKPSPTTKGTSKDQALRSLGHGVLPPRGENEAPRRRATEGTFSQINSAREADAATQYANRRIASQDTTQMYSPPASRSRFLERATPETLEEEQRLARLEEERRRRTAERAIRQREEREEEEARERAFIERKERERARRVELARQGEARRAEERRRDEEARAERESKEAKEREERAIRDMESRAKAQKRIEASGSGMELLSGFVTFEMASVWRRRYFKLSTESWQFFRNDKDVAHPVHVIELAHLRALREWNDGYEELEAIPHSFAIELTDGGSLQFFADSAEDKEILLGLLNQAAGL